jgi:hypothetical protein
MVLALRNLARKDAVEAQKISSTIAEWEESDILAIFYQEIISEINFYYNK